MLTMRQLHQRFNESTGVTFASLYPGTCRVARVALAHSGVVVLVILEWSSASWKLEARSHLLQAPSKG